MTTSDTPPDGAQRSAADELAAAFGKGSSGGITFERTGGGRGPGWSGTVYTTPAGVQLEAQLGIGGEFRGPDLESVVSRAIEELGGGRYTWRCVTSDGKRATGDIVFPGAPRVLNPQGDPAAAAQAAWGAFGQPAGSPANPYQATAGANSYSAAAAPDRLPTGWNWSTGRTQWFWVDDSGQITAPPAGVRPPGPPPGASPYYGGGMLHQDGETPAVRALKDELKEVKAALLAKPAGNDFGPMMAMMIQGMQAQNQMMLGMHAASTEAASQRAQQERDARATEQQAREAIWQEQKALLLSAAKGGHGSPSQDPLRAAVDKAIADRIGTNLFGDGKDKKEDDATPNERIGEKVVDGLTELISFGKKWLDKKDAEPKKDAPKDKAKNGTTNGHGHKPESSGDADLDRWLVLLEVAEEAYTTKQTPQTGFAMLVAAARAGGIDIHGVIAAAKQLSTRQLMALISAQGEPVATRAKPILSAFGTGDGQAWFERVLQVARGANVTAGEG